MIIWVRNIVIILFILTLIYLALSSVSRFRHRHKLLTDYKAAHAETAQEDFMAKGMQKYERSMKPKLFIGVYLFPLAVIILLGYLAQHS